MTVGLSGAHRTGKSTLAKAYAEAVDAVFIPSRTREVFAAFGRKYGDPMTPDQRLDIQEATLKLWVSDVTSVPIGDPWISDRTPLDMAAYVLAELPGQPGLDHGRVARYVDQCFWEVNRLCSVAVLVPPGIPYVEEEGKPPNDPTAQERHHFILWGLMHDRRMTCQSAYLHREVTDLNERVKALQHLNKTLTRNAERFIENALDEGEYCFH